VVCFVPHTYSNKSFSRNFAHFLAPSVLALPNRSYDYLGFAFPSTQASGFQ
jgi:hypothetical protein